MTAPHADQLIDGYLARLRAAASDLPKSARDELISDMRSHIAEARSRESAEETDATILNILDRLGEPAVVVAEARERLGVRMPQPERPGLLEIASLVLLPFVWPVGVILLWLSPMWKTRDKVIGSLFSLGGYPTMLVIGAMATGTIGHTGILLGGSSGNCGGGAVDSAGNIIQTACSGPSVLDIIGAVAQTALLVVFFLLPVLTAAYLAIRLRWGRRLEAAAI
jgi:hypothetical protein